MLFNLFFSVALAACPKMYGSTNGSQWSFSTEQKPGMVEVEVDPATCNPFPGALTLSGGKYVISNPPIIQQIKDQEAAEKVASDPVLKMKSLEDRIKALEDKTK